MTSSLFIRLFVFLQIMLIALPSAHAQQSLCGGHNILEELKTSNPEVLKVIEDEAATIPYSDGGIWKIQKDGGEPSYLFGTMHLSDPRVLNIAAKANSAFAQADTLAIEVKGLTDPNRAANTAGLIMKYAVSNDGVKMTERLSETDKAQLESALLEKHGMPWPVVDNMRPWFVMTMVALPGCELTRQKQGKKGLDASLELRAKELEKNIVGLETTESQLKALSSLPDKLMVSAVLQSVRMGKRMDDMFETMISLYQQGKLGTIWAMMRRVSPEGKMTTEISSDYSQFQRSIVDKRNFDMADGMVPLIEAGNAFVAVGALHLPGEKGILNILAQRGYTITAP